VDGLDLCGLLPDMVEETVYVVSCSEEYFSSTLF
jgi:hypothetical protein